MKRKIVFFGRTRTVQVQCPECKEWQFIAENCCECGYDFSKEEVEQDRPEYRFGSFANSWKKRIKKPVREKVYQRDEYICQYCGIWCYESYVQDDRAVTVDHLSPVSSGGIDDEDNLITCCRECNFIKNDRRFDTFEEAREYILKNKRDYKDNKDYYDKLQTVSIGKNNGC